MTSAPLSSHEMDLKVITASDLQVGNTYHRFLYVSAFPHCAVKETASSDLNKENAS